MSRSTVFAKACDLFTLTISYKKTKFVSQGTHVAPSITLNGDTLKTIEKFFYLGSIIYSKPSLEDELNSRIGTTNAAFGKLNKIA